MLSLKGRIPSCSTSSPFHTREEDSVYKKTASAVHAEIICVSGAQLQNMMFFLHPWSDRKPYRERLQLRGSLPHKKKTCSHCFGWKLATLSISKNLRTQRISRTGILTVYMLYCFVWLRYSAVERLLEARAAAGSKWPAGNLQKLSCREQTPTGGAFGPFALRCQQKLNKCQPQLRKRTVPFFCLLSVRIFPLETFCVFIGFCLSNKCWHNWDQLSRSYIILFLQWATCIIRT